MSGNGWKSTNSRERFFCVRITLQLTQVLFQDKIKSDTLEGSKLKYYIYYNITKAALAQGKITYDTTLFGVNNVVVDESGLKDIMDATGTDFVF